VLKPLLVVLVYLAVIFIYPRILLNGGGPGDPWVNYLYMYGFGAITFFTGIKLILSSKACQLGRGHDSKWFGFLVGGFLFFSLFHASWVYLALNLPVKGGM
jgi:hypothetical protein